MAGTMCQLNIAEFNAAINRFSKTITEKQFPAFIRGLAMRLLRGIVLKNPVGNPDLWKVNRERKAADSGYKVKNRYVGGRSRANWQLSIGSITDNEIEQGGSTMDAGVIIEQAQGALKGLMRHGIGEIIWIYNNVPYIMALEEGHSGQAPDGMVEVTFAEVAAGIPGEERVFIGYGQGIG